MTTSFDPTIIKMTIWHRRRSDSGEKLAMPTQTAMPAQKRFLVAHTPQATERILRSLTEALENAKAHNATQHLHTLTQLGGLVNVHATHADDHLRILRDSCDSPCQRTREIAYKAIVQGVRGLPTKCVVAHLLPLARVLASVIRLRTSPCALLALAAVITASSPLRAQGADVSVAAIVDQSLSCILSISNSRPALCVAFACVTSAPSLVRPHIALLTERARQLFHSPVEATRHTAASLVARLVLARSESTRMNACAKILDETCDEMDSIVAILRRYTPNPPKDCGTMDHVKTLTEIELAHRFQSLAHLFLLLLCQPVFLSSPVPLSRAVSSLLAALQLNEVDPIASSLLPPSLHPALVLSILSAIQATVLKVIPALFESVGKSSALPLTPHVFKTLTNMLLDRFTIDNPYQAVLARCKIYNGIAALIEATNAAQALPLARALSVALEADVIHLSVLENVRKSDISAVYSNTRTDASLGNSRKRRRRARGAATQAAEAVSNATSTLMSQDALWAATDAVKAGIQAAACLLGAAAVADKQQRSSLRKIERSLNAALTIPSARSAALDALAVTVLTSGSAATFAHASPVLQQVLLSVDRVENNQTVLKANAALDAVLHPRGPPVINTQSNRNTISSAVRHNPPRDAIADLEARIGSTVTPKNNTNNVDPPGINAGAAKEKTRVVTETHSPKSADRHVSFNEVVTALGTPNKPFGSLRDTARTEALCRISGKESPPVTDEKRVDSTNVQVEELPQKHLENAVIIGQVSKDMNKEASSETVGVIGEDDVRQGNRKDMIDTVETESNGGEAPGDMEIVMANKNSDGSTEMYDSQEKEDVVDEEAVLSALVFEASDED